MTAKKALSRGMINSIKEDKPAGRSGLNKGKKSMNRDELKAQYPDLYAAIFNDGVEAGKAEVAEQVQGHADLAEISGDAKRALEVAPVSWFYIKI